MARSLLYASVVVLSVASAGQAATFQTIYAFGNRHYPDGSWPNGPLLIDKSGLIYGSTSYGGSAGVGTVFRIYPPIPSRPQWYATKLYDFRDSKDDGNGPGSPLVMDGAGNLYGTTRQGGSSKSGTIFRLSPPTAKDGTWTETILYTFNGKTDGRFAYGALVLVDGELYGTTQIGGLYSNGTVWKFSIRDRIKTTIYSFKGGGDGGDPIGVVRDASGVLFGATVFGGVKSNKCGDGCGTVFKLSPPAAGSATWSESVIHRFQGTTSDTRDPNPPLAIDSKGTIFGTTPTTDAGGGAVFALKPQSDATYSYSVLYQFPFDSAYGPSSGVVLDGSGSLYGTTFDGVIFKLTPPSSGATSWNLTVLHTLAQREGALLTTPTLYNGILFGSTIGGGVSPNGKYRGEGIVYEVEP